MSDAELIEAAKEALDWFDNEANWLEHLQDWDKKTRIRKKLRKALRQYISKQGGHRSDDELIDLAIRLGFPEPISEAILKYGQIIQGDRDE